MKKYFLLIIVILLTSTLYIHYTQAVENIFEVSASVVEEDNFPPSIPTGLIATPVSSSQINLIWNASTDDTGVVGYRIFRDDIVIATTTLLFYNNTSLTASTTYTYAVEAFDRVPRFSGQSATTSTTTLEESIIVIPPTPTTTPSIDLGSSSSGSRVLKIDELKTTTTYDSAIVTFTTTQAAQTKIFWGITENYELGSISGFYYELDHKIKIPSLNSDTKYFFRIEAVNQIGFTVSEEGSFQSQKVYNFSRLANVTHFQAIPQENSIALLWNIPRNKDIESVKIIKSDKFFPRDINDGEIIFEGYSEEYLDTEVVKDKAYYYAIFSKDANGNYSSGVLAQARIGKPLPITATSTDPFLGIPIVENLNSIIRELKFSDFDFIQDNVKIENTESIVAIDGSKNLTILLDYNKVPEILKTIAITLTDPKDSTKIFTFLLRVNKEKTQYEATIAPLGESGKYKMNIIVLDYKNQGLKRMDGLLNALVWQGAQEIFKNCAIFDEYGECSSLNKRNSIIAFSILLILLVIAILRLVLRRRDKKTSESNGK